MKRNITLIAFLAMAAFIISQSFFQDGFSNRLGAPIARTGSPFDNGGTACNANGCHTGFSVTNATGWITSNIPPTGYLSGNTYTITATATFTGLIRFGFEISPQKPSNGILAGTIVITDAINTRLAGSNNPKYITHDSTGTNASSTPGSKTW